jgi:hypothetical protein
MGKRQIMEHYGAKLTNYRWSWDGVRKDGSIIFLGWKDEVKQNPDNTFECRIREDSHPANVRRGGKERERHIAEIMKRDSAAYLLIAIAKDQHADPRTIEKVEETLFPVRLVRRGSEVFTVSTT